MSHKVAHFLDGKTKSKALLRNFLPISPFWIDKYR